jgi:hypothetical protein
MSAKIHAFVFPLIILGKDLSNMNKKALSWKKVRKVMGWKYFKGERKV